MKRKITAKILIALSCISLMMPFYFIKEVNAAVTDLTITITAGESDTYIQDDPEDSRYYLMRKYISFNYSEPCLGWYYISFGTMSNYASSSVALDTLFSYNGARVTGDYIYNGSSTYGLKYRVDFTNLTENLMVLEYRVLKTVYDAHPFEFIYEGITWDDGNLVPNNTAIIPLRLEEIDGNIELLILNENLSDQEIEGYLQQINQNYLPTMIDLLESIKDNLQNNGNSNSTISAKISQNYTLSSPWGTWHQLPSYTLMDNVGSDFEFISNGSGIKCKRDGYILILIKAWFDTGNTNNSVRVGINARINGVNIDQGATFAQCIGTVTLPNVFFIEVEENDIITLAAINGGPINAVVGYTTSMTLQYIGSSDNQELAGIISILNVIQANQTTTLSDLSQIISLLNEIKANTAQQETINNINTELNIYNQSITTITNSYNTQFTDLNDELDFTDLINVDPESEHNILNDVNFYNTTFEGLINIPYMKSILIFLLLCILIVALVG